MRSSTGFAAVVSMIVLGCGDTASPTQTGRQSEGPASPQPSSAPNPAPAPKPAPAPTPSERPTFSTCTDREFPPGEAASFRHRRSEAIAQLGSVAHSAQDVLVLPGQLASIPGKFAYGRVSKDLEDESVELFIDMCETWKRAGAAITDDDGRTAIRLAPETVPGVGAFTLGHRVVGDGTTVTSRLTVAPKGSRVILFDVDGTLTIGDSELRHEMTDVYLREIGSGVRRPRPYAGAAELTQAWAAKGYLILYLTGRPYWLAGMTRRWLNDNKFAPGHLHTTDRTRDARPTGGGVGDFKAAYVSSVREAGYVLQHVYGNAKTDIAAYASAGVPAKSVHIVGEHGGKGGTVAVGNDYVEHLTWVADQPAAQQPFVWRPQ